VIVDASVAVKWFVPEVLSEEARALLASTEPLVAPDLLAIELANAMWSKTRRGEIDEADAVRAIAGVIEKGQPQLRSSTPLIPRAFELARTFDHSVYDCVYIAMAEALDTVLVTADQRLLDAAEPQARVRFLGATT
jgi:predicted nucleic acid-binding protein